MYDKCIKIISADQTCKHLIVFNGLYFKITTTSYLFTFIIQTHIDINRNIATQI